MSAESLVGSASGLLGSLVDRWTASTENRKQRDFEREMAEYENQKNIELWKMENEYNTPEAQMQRFKDAGLNPNLMYDKGDSGNAGSIAPYQAPQGKFGLPPINLTEAFSMYQDAGVKQAQTDNLRAQNNLIEEQKNRQIIDNLLASFNLGNELGDNTPPIVDDKYSFTWGGKKGEGKAFYDMTKALNEAEIVKRQNQLDKKYLERQRLAETLTTEYIKSIKKGEKFFMEEDKSAYIKSEGRVKPGDNYQDRTFDQIFGSEGQTAKGFMQFLQMIRAITGR